ncbi:MAG: Nramp family divalent metal transporter [Gammaproteobacteria bacterium]|nr:Nramp family divalent metal transporter [Gammaproteobacteria bacterium]
MMKRFGPGLLVTAAFIGPGTVTTTSVAGAGFGYALLWTLVFSVVATIVLQEMAARLGLVSGRGLSEALRGSFRHPLARGATAFLVVAAIGLGNAAFETGNITGAALGLAVLSDVPVQAWSLIVGMVAFLLLAVGLYRVVERVLILLVAVMSLVFVLTMVSVVPDLPAMFRGMFRPSLPNGSLLTAIALIGTTVVPYNLFLHASTVHEKWGDVPTRQALAEARADTVLSVSLGGLLTLAVMTTAATAFFATGTDIDSAATMARQLEPLLGEYARYLFAVGLLSAGITSAVTAPLAAAYATAGMLGWPRDLSDRRFQAVWATIIIIGVAFAVSGTSPIAAIVFAQAANGMLLPVVAIFLLIIMNRDDVLGDHRNGWRANILGAAVITVATSLGVFQLLRVAGVVGG